MNKQVELLNLYNEIISDNEAQIIEYSISDGYVSNLTPVFGIKEFIANFLDANGENFDMSYSKKTLLLSDDNDGVNIKYMIIGNSGSRENVDKIGEHGEGFKVGALTLVREGYKVLFHTVGYSIAFGMKYNDILNANVMYAKYRPNSVTKGTTVFLECSKKEYENARSMFLHLTDFQHLTDNIIIPTHNKMIKEMYLNGLLHTNKKSLFSYNFKQKGLVSNRDRNFIQQSVIEENLIKIYENLFDSEVINKVMTELLDNGQDFYKYLESTIFHKLSLSTEQKQMYLDSIPSHYYFTNNKESLHPKVLNKYDVIEVDDKLIYFLEQIGANILSLNKNDNSFGHKSFQIPIDKLPNQDDLEIEIMEQITEERRVSFDENHTLSCSFIELSELNYSLEDFKSFLQQFSLSIRVFNGKKNKLKYLINNLILLSCHDISIQFKIEDKLFTIESTLTNNYNVVIKSEDNRLLKRNTLFLTKPLPTNELYIEESDKYLYLYSFKYKKINAILSYILKPTSVDFYERRELQKLFDSIFKTKKFNSFFLDKLIKAKHDNSLFEKDYLTPKEEMKKYGKQWFSKKYPSYCLPTLFRKEFDTIVVNNYGYKLFNCSNSVNHMLNEYFGLPNSENIFNKEQESDIVTVEFTDAMNEAYDLFKQIHPYADVNIYCAYQLTEKRHSLTKDGNIYISKEIAYSSYILTLMHYEYEKLSANLTSPSTELQSILTHSVLDDLM